MLRLITLLAALCLIAMPAYAGSLAGDIRADLDKPDLAGAVVGVEVADVKTGKVLFEQNAATHVMPASNRKLFTSAAALELLGDDTTLKTLVVADTKPDANGVVNGNLYLKGGGDSLLAPGDLDQLAKSLSAQGIKQITGDVIGDGSFFQGSVYPVGWDVDDLSAYYSPEVTGLELAEGVEVVHVAGGAKPGDPVIVTLYPATNYIPIVIKCTTGAAGSSADLNIYRPLAQNEIDIEGSVPPGYKSNRPDGLVTVHDPPFFAASYFLETLRGNGIEVDGQARTGTAPLDGAVLAEHDSAPMAQYIRLMNKPSDNLMAESLVRALGAIKGKDGSYWSGHVVEQAFFEKQMGVTPYDLVLFDGSGLSRMDMVTARAVVSLLIHMAAEPDFKSYYDSLPIAGVDGTMARRLRGTIAAGNAHAKTGSFNSCRSVSGYVTTRRGRMLAFSMIMNNYNEGKANITSIQDAIILRLAQEK